MRIHVKSFRSQAGGSTLIGLVLGVCTGILMLIKWPELADYIEPHVQQFLAADLDSVASSIVASTQNLADESRGQLDNSALTGIWCPNETQDFKQIWVQDPVAWGRRACDLVPTNTWRRSG